MDEVYEQAIHTRKMQGDIIYINMLHLTIDKRVISSPTRLTKI